MKLVFSKGTATNVRPTSSTVHAPIDTISQNQGAVFIKTVNSVKNEHWHQVMLRGEIGFVMSAVSVVSEVANPYKDQTFDGSIVPYAPASRDTVSVLFSSEMTNIYKPILDDLDAPIGIKLLAEIMAQQEGFRKGNRSFRTNNPGNIGNTDNGSNRSFKTLREGIQFQLEFLENIANGFNRNFPVGRSVHLRPYYSKEIARNKAVYQMEPYCPGYRFTYTGQLDQFVKIYATGPRQKNTYLSLIRSHFKNNGYEITDETTLKEIMEL